MALVRREAAVSRSRRRRDVLFVLCSRRRRPHVLLAAVPRGLLGVAVRFLVQRAERSLLPATGSTCWVP